MFSFGVILFEMLTGELPYEGETAVSKVMMRLTEKPRSPRQITIDVPAYLEKVIFKCLEQDLEVRYSSAVDVLKDLERERVDRSINPWSAKGGGASHPSLRGRGSVGAHDWSLLLLRGQRC